jgi:hypothetical protein
MQAYFSSIQIYEILNIRVLAFIIDNLSRTPTTHGCLAPFGSLTLSKLCVMCLAKVLPKSLWAPHQSL